MPGPAAPSTIWNEPSLQVAVPALFTVRRTRFVPVVPIWMPPLAFVVPKPSWVPPFQVNRPLISRSPAPPTVPLPDCVSVTVVAAVEVFWRFRVPLVRVVESVA